MYFYDIFKNKFYFGIQIKEYYYFNIMYIFIFVITNIFF